MYYKNYKKAYLKNFRYVFLLYSKKESWNHYKGGTLADFKERVKNIYGEYGEIPNEKYYRQYMAAIEFFEKMAELGKE